jgi:putative addiction module component (TIGR02574 family)
MPTWYHPPMSSKLLEAATELSESERILLVEQIWDPLAEKQSGPELTPAQTTELARRLK